MELRLQKRYRQRVESHFNVVQAVAAGGKAIPGDGQAFAATPAAWRFFRNPKVTLPELVQPLRDVGRQACRQSNSAYVLVAFDWSKMDYDGHANRRDLTQLSQELDCGYEMAMALLNDVNNGAPLAPMGLIVLCEPGMFSTETIPLPRVAYLDQIVRRGKSRSEVGAVDHPVRRIVISSRALGRMHPGNSTREQIILLKSLADVPAEVIAAIYSLRWTIELFFFAG